MNQQILLATSIPPLLRGQPLDPAQPQALQQRVLQSWQQAGVMLVSLHTTAELSGLPQHQERLHQLGVAVQPVLPPPCASNEPLPNLRAALTALASHNPDALIGLTNADILLADPGRLNRALAALQPDQFLLTRRTNVADPDAPPGSHAQIDCHGFDLFVFHAATLTAALPLIPENLAFGRPWWDLFLPLALMAAGARPVHPGSDLIFHPIHSERWDVHQWHSFGLQADQRFLQLLRQQGCSAFLADWKRRRLGAFLRWKGRAVHQHRLLEHLQALRSGRSMDPLHLHDVSDLINAWLDQCMAQPAPTAIQRLLRYARYSLWTNRLRQLRHLWFRAQGMAIGPGTRLGRISVAWPQAVRLGSHCLLDNHVQLHYQGPNPLQRQILIGNNVYLAADVQLNSQAHIQIGDDVMIGAGTRLIDHNHGFRSLERPMRAQPIEAAPISIEDDVWIGANVIILKGITVGRGSVIGAGSVVTRSIPPGQIWVGNPARFVRSRP